MCIRDSSEIVEVVRERFGLTHLVMVGDRGMITSARIEALRELGGLGWLTALRAPQIKALADDQGPLQLSLFDEVNFCELTHPAVSYTHLDPRRLAPRPKGGHTRGRAGLSTTLWKHHASSPLLGR